MGRQLTMGLFPVYVALSVAGLFFSALALFSYFVRYAHLDSLEEQIPHGIYLQATSMFGIERVLLVGGAGLFVIGAALAIVAGITRSRRPR
ncbi:hypothetical protein [Sinomonas sp. ASV322]|uniref:hypothetical protein n=1 Tax=Sinomonas sp. ASV322 TaxID=3041920 RepID=UPI0027DDCB61|nr:hypothetical protein [Sinomonas sp. ASV322]MDQ4502039.1 hypothetical protein [Sinomonas sp. ASV322]